MAQLEFRPPVFFLTGVAWLIASALLGLGLLLGMVLGHPLPPFFRLLHVHGALVGGVAQMILGALLVFIPPLLMTGRDQSESHPALYLTINGGTIILLIGFGMRHHMVISIAGLLIVGVFLAILAQGIRQARSSLISPPLNLWFYGVALLVLLVGLALGEALAFRVISPSDVGHARLAHIHLNLLGFVTLTIIGTMHNLFPTVVNAPLHSPRVARLTFFLMPPAVVALIAGFLLTNLWVQIIAGVVLVVGSLLYAYNILRTWIAAGKPKNIASDHLMVATVFLVLAIAAGVLVSVNYLWYPPIVPFGTLHLVAYTHLALVGFILQTIFGALSHLLPISLAARRVPSHKKRGPYLDQLTETMGRWRGLQVATISLGTLGLAVVASLVWQFPLRSLPVKAATWTTIVLLFLSFLLFSVKLGLLWGKRPSD